MSRACDELSHCHEAARDANGQFLAPGDFVRYTPPYEPFYYKPGNPYYESRQCGEVLEVSRFHGYGGTKVRVYWPRCANDPHAHDTTSVLSRNLTLIARAPEEACDVPFIVPETMPKCLCGEPMTAADWCLNCGVTLPEPHERFGMSASEYLAYLAYLKENPGIRLRREVWLASHREKRQEAEIYGDLRAANV